MGRGMRIGTVAGAPVEVSPWWFLIAGVLTLWVAPVYADWLPGLGRTGEYLLGAVFVALLYASAFLHELGHAFSARAFGLTVHRVELTALGGLTTMDAPTTPGRAAVTSAAGPAVNIGLVVVAVGAINLTADGTLPHLLAAQLAWTNALIAVFNLLPGFPLDGGSILRAGIWKVTGRPGTGTVVAAWVGRGVAVLAGLWFVRGLVQPSVTGSGLGSLWFLLIAGWIWAASSSAIATERARAAVPGLSARGLARPALTAAADDPLALVLERMSSAGLRACVVADSAGTITGILNEAAVVATPVERRPWISASDVARRLVPQLTIDAELEGDALMHVLASAPATEYLVRASSGDVVGVLSFSDVEAALARR